MADGVLRREVFDVWRGEVDTSRRTICVFNYVVSKYNLQNCSEDIHAQVKQKSDGFCKKLKQRWTRSHYILEKILQKNYDWLNGEVIFPEAYRNMDPPNQEIVHIGRPLKLFNESGDRSRKRKIKPLLEENSIDELVLATEMGLRSTGKRDAAQLVKQVATCSPKRATKIKKAYNSPAKMPIKMTGDEALAFFVDKKFTKEQYISMRQISKAHNADIFPSYHVLLESKKSCYPEEISITESSADINLQSLLDHTIKRLISVQYEVLEQARVGIDTLSTVNIIFKWGCDGASGHNKYKQKFSHQVDEDVDDAYTFVVSLVPLQMTTYYIVGTSTSQPSKIILWQNPLPASTKYCRPIKVMLKKETADLTKTTIAEIKSQIAALTPTIVHIDGREIRVTQELVLTMIDGKICSVLSNQASQNCHVCGATPSQMNNLDLVRQRQDNETAKLLGLSSLHAWIKLFECVLNIFYRLDIKCWQIRKERKHMVDERKKEIQNRFRRELGLLVDIPKPGFGTTNDGNSARRFFDNPALASDITGVDEELIRRFGVILKTIASGYSIDLNKFEKYCSDTAELYVQKYKWYYMPQSVHKILIHGAQLIKCAVLPVGMMSEEAQEARNKDYKLYREYHTRKFSRRDTMTDLMNMLLISSDPAVSSLRIKRQKKSKSFSPEVLALLLDAGNVEDNEEDD